MTTLMPTTLPIRARWTRAMMERHDTWRISAPMEIEADADRIARWAATVPDPESSLTRESVDLPCLRALASRVGYQLDHGTGVAWLRHLPPLDAARLRLVYLALGLELGTTIDTYGRLYDVVDSGLSYTEQAVPVSQTRESTSMHTDGSAKNVWPRIVGLLCLRPALTGGESRIVSAVEVHERLRATSSKLLARLYGTFVRDVVTPRSDRSPSVVADNRFPIFARRGRPTLRYMRYWIERGHERVGEPLADEDRAALDMLDHELNDSHNVVSFRLSRGDMLFIDNTTIAHDRDAFVDDPAAPRRLVRLWLDRPAPFAV